MTYYILVHEIIYSQYYVLVDIDYKLRYYNNRFWKFTIMVQGFIYSSNILE